MIGDMNMKTDDIIIIVQYPRVLQVCNPMQYEIVPSLPFVMAMVL